MTRDPNPLLVMLWLICTPLAVLFVMLALLAVA